VLRGKLPLRDMDSLSGSAMMFSPASHGGAQLFAFGKLNRIFEFQAAGHADRFFGISPVQALSARIAGHLA
jgi:hypothetical protein